jgi:hypothetical protein
MQLKIATRKKLYLFNAILGSVLFVYYLVYLVWLKKQDDPGEIVALRGVMLVLWLAFTISYAVAWNNMRKQKNSPS